MVQSINKIHTDSAILNSNEGVKYKFNGTNWIRNDDINLIKYVDVSIDDIRKVLDPTTLSLKDYIEISKSYSNYMLQSELLTSDTWKNKNLIISTTSTLFKFPDNANPCFTLRTPLNITSPEEYELSQRFTANLSKTYLFSMFVKNFDESEFSKIALSIKDRTYNIMASVKFDLNIDFDGESAITIDSNTKLIRLNDDVKFYNSKTLEELEDQSIGKRYFGECGAGILRIKGFEDKFYFRPFILFGIKNNTNFSTGIHLLDEMGRYYFRHPNDVVRFYSSGAQLEQYDNLFKEAEKEQDVNIKNQKIKDIKDSIQPGPYMITYKVPVSHTLASELWTSDRENFIKLNNNKIHYINSTTEGNTQSGDIKIVSSKPSLVNATDNDIAVIQNVISFGTISSTRRKTFPIWTSNTYYKINDKVLYMNTLYRCKVVHTSSRYFQTDAEKWDLIVDGVGLGTKDINNAPLNCIYYDKKTKTYKIKKSTLDGDVWLTLDFTSEEIQHYAMIHAMTYGQGRYETWCEQSNFEPYYIFGFNTGGNYNFVKLSHISKYI